MVGQRLYIEFKDNNGNNVEYINIFDTNRDGIDYGRHIFLLSAQDYGYRIEISHENGYVTPTSRITICTEDANADYIIKSLEIDETDFSVELNNQFGPHGNYENGIKRYLWYRNASLNGYRDNLLFMNENEWYDKGHSLSGDSGGIRIDGKNITGCLENQQFHAISSQIVAHPRNQELILFTIDELNKQLPGIKNFVATACPLYGFITNNFETDISPEVDALIQSTIHPNCNLPEETVARLKR